MRRRNSGLACLVCLTGCTVWQPFIPLPQQKVDPQSFAGTLPAAINDSIDHLGAFEYRANEHSRIRNVTTAALIPLTAFTMYKGVTPPNDNQHQIIALGLGAAAINYGGSQFYSKDKQRMYLEGARSVNCAINASRSYLVTKGLYQSVQHGKQDVSDEVPNVDRAIGKLQKAQSEVGDLDEIWTRRVDTEVRRARSLITRASITSASTETATGLLDGAGPRLLGQVNTITEQVNIAITKTELDLATVSAIKDALSKSLASFAPSAKTENGTSGAKLPENTGGPQSRDKTVREMRAKARAKLDSALIALASESAILAAKINGQNVLLKDIASRRQEAAEALKQCDPDVGTHALAIQPNVSTMTLSQETPRRPLEVKNGSISWPPAGSGANSLELLSEGGTLYTIGLKGSKAPAEDEDAQVTILGKNGEQRVIDLTLTAAPAPSPALATAHETPAVVKKQVKPTAKPSVDPAIINCVQNKIGLSEKDQDGKVGPVTQAAIKQYAKENGLPEDVGYGDKLLASTGCKVPQQ